MYHNISIFDEAMVYLINNKRFIANLMLHFKRVIVKNPNPMPTACIGFRNASIVMTLNEDFLSKLTVEQRAGILEHECLHVLFHHIKSDLSKDLPLYNHKAMNVAMDLVINQISDLERVITSITEEDPTTGEKRFLLVSIPSMKQEFDLDVPRNQTSLFYYNMLLKESEKNQKLRDMITEYQFVHDFGDDMPEALKELLIKNAIAKAKQATGRLSGGYEELVNQLLSSKVDWRKHINNFISNSVEVTHTQSRTKRNRRYGILYPGKSVEPKRSIAYIEDTSGSMSIEQISQGRAELVKIQKLYPDFTIYLIQADSEVKDAIELKKAPPPTVKGRGGTAYQPAIDKAVELGCDSIVYYGDMDCADIPNDPKIPVLWAVTGGQKPPVTWGKYVRVE